MTNKDRSSGNTLWKNFSILSMIILFVAGFQVKSMAKSPSSNYLLIKNVRQGSVFTIDEKTTKKDLKEIETFFAENHPNLLVRFGNVQINARGHITGFELQTKFKGDDVFHTRLKKTKKSGDWEFRLKYQKGPALSVQQTGDHNFNLVIWKDNLKFN